ncbi:LysE family translocator [Neisseria dentiae]|uniref:LysE family translocator n=1 Tax=Neisseria dentiae TaxID=194197 RepID=UPI0035A1B429
MIISVLLTYILTVCVFLIIPGPVNLVVINTAARYGLKGALFAVIGTNAASLVLILTASLMIAGLGKVNAQFLTLLSGLGGGYLIYYGYKLFWDSRRKKQENKSSVEIVELPKIIINSFMVGISNPKDVIFFMTFFPPFINQLEMSLFSSLLVLTLIWCVLDYSILLAYGLGISKIMSPKCEQAINAVCSLLFIGIGIHAVYQAV